MKTKKLMSTIIVLAIVLSMMLSMSISASAVVEVKHAYVGEIFTFNDMANYKLSAAEVKDNINPTSVTIDDSCSEYFELVETYSDSKNSNIVTYKIKAIKPTDDNVKVKVNYSLYNGTNWEAGECEYVQCIVDRKCYLDTTDNTKTFDQLYDVEVDSKNTDVTKVQVSWTLEKINASITSNMIWDTENLKWIEDTSKTNGVSVEPVTAEFNFVNLSSVEVGAQVTFKAAGSFEPEAKFEVDDAEKTYGYKNLASKADDAEADNEGKIEVTLTPGNSDFTTITESETNKTYGTYTIKISKPLYLVTVGYYENSEEAKKEYLVEKNTEISVNSTKIKVGTNAEITTDTEDNESRELMGWVAVPDIFSSITNGYKVTKDVDIAAIYGGI